MFVNCTSFYMQVDFALRSQYLDTETFRFENRSCGSHTHTSVHVSLRTELDACGTVRRDSGDAVTYLNKVVAETSDKETIYIVEFPFSCTYLTHQTIGVPSFQPKKKVTFFEGKTTVFSRNKFKFKLNNTSSCKYKPVKYKTNNRKTCMSGG